MIDLNLVLGTIFGGGFTGVIAAILRFFTDKRKLRTDDDDAILRRLREENTRLVEAHTRSEKRAALLEEERDLEERRSVAYRRALASNEIHIPDVK